MELVVSGARPTGDFHLGNYFGAIKNFVNMQNTYNCFFFIADLHSLTTHPNATELPQLTRKALATYLGCGLNPDKVTLFIQSQVPQISELYLIFNNLAYKGELEKCPTFKDKVRSQEAQNKSINAGLLTYPVLMAVDIIIHKATKVPVGKDQQPHIEMARNFVNRFNHLYQVNYFPEPIGFNFGEDLLSVPALDGEGKMSKSSTNPNSYISLFDSDELIRKKLMKAKTDAGPTQTMQTKPIEIQNLFTIMSLVSSESTINHFNTLYNNATIRYGDFKKQIAEDIITHIAPIRNEINDIFSNDAYLKKVIKDGGEKARASAAKTINDVKNIIGLNF